MKQLLWFFAMQRHHNLNIAINEVKVYIDILLLTGYKTLKTIWMFGKLNQTHILKQWLMPCIETVFIKPTYNILGITGKGLCGNMNIVFFHRLIYWILGILMKLIFRQNIFTLTKNSFNNKYNTWTCRILGWFGINNWA